MQLEQEVLRKLIDYLKGHGYPEESIAIEYKIGPFRADLAVIDPNGGLPIQIFELKGKKHPQQRRFGIQQLRAFAEHVDTPDIPTYLVFPRIEDPGFEIERVYLKSARPSDEYVAESQTAIQTLNFDGQRNARYFEKGQDLTQQKKDTRNRMLLVSWLAAPAVLALGVLNYLRILSLSATDLTLLGATLGLLLIPFASKLKMLGIEFERHNPDKNAK